MLAKDIKVMSARGDGYLDIIPIADDLLLLLEHCKKERHAHNARVTMGLVLATQHPMAFLGDVFEQEADEPLRSHLSNMIRIGETYEIPPTKQHQN